ncbi:MAG: hypothetical protein KDK70_27655, partial [Myxococcales bacterium]|nr:hypothetical protein [Myxococcales bacterium]
MRGRAWAWAWALLPLAACGGPEPEGRGSDDPGSSASGPSTSGSSADVDSSASSAAATSTGTEADGSTGTETEGSTGTETGQPLTCAVVDVEGICEPVARCPRGSTPFQALCEGPPSEQCCVPAAPPCSVDGAPGLCLPLASCPAGLQTTPGLCPGAADIQCCTDPATACDPLAMPLPNEGLEEQSWDPACPPGMVGAGEVCIDRFEAALVVLDDAGAVLGHHSPYFNPGSTRVRAVSLAGAIPQGYISQLQAEAACVEAGKRLCTDVEWLRACQGAGTTTYPWGDVPEPGRCNDARASHPVIEYFGTSDPWIWSELDHPCI